MEKKVKEAILYSIALVLVATMIIIAIYLIQSKDYEAFLWGCYLCIPLIILGIFLRNPYIIIVQVLVLAIPDLMKVFDLIMMWTSGYSPLGMSTIFFQRPFIGKLAMMQHFYTVPLALWALALIKIKVKENYRILLAGLGEIVVIFFLTFFLVTNGETVNCVHVNCTSISIPYMPYFVLWFAFAFAFVSLTYFLIINLNFIKGRKRKKISE